MNDDQTLHTQQLSFVVPLSTRVADLLTPEDIPFAPRGSIRASITRFLTRLTIVLESHLGVELFVRAYGDELDLVGRGLKSLLYRLLRAGIVESFMFRPTVPNWPDVIFAGFDMAPVKLPSGVFHKMSGTTAGCAFDHETAMRIALAELLERYSLATYQSDNFITASFAELGAQRAIDPMDFTAFSETQLRDERHARNRFNRSSVFRWVYAQNLSRSRRVLAPAQLGYIFYEPLAEEPIIRQTTTSGAAAGNSWEMAAHNAVCETIERDAFLITWLRKLTPPRINIAQLSSPKLIAIAEAYRHHQLDYAICDITTDLGIPTFLGILRNLGQGYPHVYVTACTDYDSDAAITRLMVDLLKAGALYRTSEADLAAIALRAPSAIHSIRDRRLFWTLPAQAGKADFLFAGKPVVPPENRFPGASHQEKLRAVERRLEDADLKAYVIDITAPLARGVGLTVLMSLIPGLYPLYLDERYKYLGMKRLFEAPLGMGREGAFRFSGVLNETPHPLL